MFFRADSLHAALAIITRMLTVNPLQLQTDTLSYVALVGLLYLLHMAEHWARANYALLSARWEERFPAPVRALAYAALIVILILCPRTGQSSFIYFKF